MLTIPPLLLPILLILLVPVHQAGVFPVRMPLVEHTVEEVYLCTQVYIGQDRQYWLTGFQPTVNPSTVHHMVLALCNTNPMAEDAKVWNCGQGGAPLQPGLPHSTTCVSGALGSRSVYAWADGGQEYHLPPDTGVPVGQHTQYQYLVLQVSA